MVKCTFLGHQAVFEQDLSEKLDAAIAKIVKKSDETEFLFFEKGAFCNRCLAAVLKAQRRYPQKQIRITLVQKYGSDPKQNPIPMCMVDTVIQAPEFPQPKREKDFTLNYRRTMRWVLDQCSYLISYMYSQIQDDATHFYQIAEQKKLTILDVTSPETSAYFEEELSHRSEREQAVIKGRQAGWPWSRIGAEIGVSARMVETNARNAGRALTRYAANRLREQPKANISCAIFTLGDVTPEKTAMFRQVVSFLITRYHVMEFKITAECSYYEYMDVLRQEVAYVPGVKISIVTSYECTTVEQLHEQMTKHKDRCDKIENVNPYTKRIPRVKMLNTIRWMMGNTDYCITNLPDNPLQKSIENHARKLGGVRLVDIGKDTVLRVRCDE